MSATGRLAVMRLARMGVLPMSTRSRMFAAGTAFQDAPTRTFAEGMQFRREEGFRHAEDLSPRNARRPAVASGCAVPQRSPLGEIRASPQAAHGPEGARPHRCAVGGPAVGLGRLRLLRSNRDAAAERLRASDLTRRAIC